MTPVYEAQSLAQEFTTHTECFAASAAAVDAEGPAAAAVRTARNAVFKAEAVLNAAPEVHLRYQLKRLGDAPAGSTVGPESC